MRIAIQLRLFLSGKFNPIIVILLFQLWFVPLVKADTTVGGIIATDTIWSVTESPYIVTSDIIIKGTDGTDGITTLSIEPGVEIRMNRYRQINIGASSGDPGAIIAQGTAGHPIVFTSNEPSPAAGDWYHIKFNNTADDGTTAMEHCVIEYSGLSNSSIYIYQASPTFRSVTVRHSKKYGAYINSSEPTFENCIFSGNQNYDLYYAGTVGGSVTGSTINSGIYLYTSGAITFSGNTINQNNAFPIIAYAENVGEISNSIFNNVDADSYMEIGGGSLVTKDATWTARIPYHVLNGVLVKGTDGADGVTTLTIEPGAVLRFNPNMAFSVGASSGDPGALIAQGTTENKIVFTSNKATPTAGDWYGIRFYNTADDGTTAVEHCVIEYSGLSNSSIYIYQASPTFRSVTVRHSKKYGAYINSSEPTFENCIFSGNQNYDLYYAGTVGGSVTGSTINSGIYLYTSGAITFSGNTINQNNAFPIITSAENVGEISNSTFNNVDADSYMEINGGSLVTKDATWTARIPYHVLNGVLVKGTDGADGVTTLTIEPGAVLRFNPNMAFSVGASSGDPGALIAQGTTENKIVFTSNKATPTAGDWYGIRFYNTADDNLSALSNCIVEYAGYNNSAAVYLYDAQPSVSHCTLQNSAYAGVYLYNSNADVTNSSFSDNQYGIRCENNSQPTIQQNNFNAHTTAILVSHSAPAIGNSIFSSSSSYDLLYTGITGGSVAGCTINSGLDNMYASGIVNFSDNTINQNNASPIKTNAEHVGMLSASTFNKVDADSYMEIGGGSLVTKDATWTARIPYHIFHGVLVKGTDGADGVTTLTIEPGAVLRFNTNMAFSVGATSGDPGALIAQGTPENKILFTSSEATPAAGDWSGIRFFNTADDSLSAVSNCIVEYAGRNNSAAVYLYDAQPPVSYSIIRNSAYAGVQVFGTDPEITCNTFISNQHGVDCQNNAQPLIHQNNFSANSLYGVYNIGAPTINAEDNWWCDAAGPNTGGDGTYGNVDADPWSTTENSCNPGGDNQPPNIPSAPVPGDNAVRVELSSKTVTLHWAGGDPDLQDTVTYDVLWGESEDSLTMAAQDISVNQYTKADLAQGITYYWKVTARDNAGLEATSPVWRFTTNGGPPDLLISQFSTDPPGNIQTGQTVTLTAEISNNSSGPAVDPFSVDFQGDSALIGTVAVSQILLAGESVQVSQTWTYAGGDPIITVAADSQSQVTESDETNNSYSNALSAIADITAPSLVGTSPADGSALKQLQQITATLADSQSEVDDAAVTASFSVTDGTQQNISGTISESDDTFTFVPDSLPLPDNTYQISLMAMDGYGNTQNYQFNFTIDNQPPSKPVITGGVVDSGTIQIRPAQNVSRKFAVDLTGTREAGTSVWINGVEKVGVGDTDWLVPMTLAPGVNSIEIWLVDRAGNQGLSEWIDIEMQTGVEVDYNYDASGRVKRIESNQ